MKTFTKNDNILNLYNKLTERGDKTKFRIELSKICNRAAGTIKNSWILNKEFPEEFQDKAIDLLQKMIQNQNVSG